MSASNKTVKGTVDILAGQKPINEKLSEALYPGRQNVIN
jgi:hypothetical protein